MAPSLFSIMLTFVSSGLLDQVNEETRAWPRIVPQIEYSLDRAIGAFFGTLHLYDVEKPYPNIGVVSGRIVPETSVWGQLPQKPIELGRGRFLIHGGSGSVNAVWRPALAPLLWEGGDDSSVSRLFVFRVQDDEPEILYVCGPGRGEGGHIPPAKDFLMIQKLETMPNDDVLREGLIGVASKAESSELLWSYALRKLVKLDDDPNRRFDNVFSMKLQKTALPRRISYAREVLVGQVLGAEMHTSDGAKVTLQRSLSMIEQAPNSEVAFIGLTSLADVRFLRLANLTIDTGIVKEVDGL